MCILILSHECKYNLFSLDKKIEIRIRVIAQSRCESVQVQRVDKLYVKFSFFGRQRYVWKLQVT